MQYNDARCEFLNLLEQQEVYWKQRSKQFWLREGDQNIKKFHKFASGRRKQNQVTKLKDSNGEWKEDREGVRQIITEYFSKLFQSSVTTTGLTDRETVKQVTAEQNQNLIMPITSDEVKCAVFTMHPDKSPSFDGLNPGFFQAYWKVVGNNVVQFC